MPELRHDVVTRRWVIIATQRSRRPEDFLFPDEEISDPKFCPFCPGHEDRTPPEIAAVRPPASPANGPDWSARVVPNKYPALMIEGELERRGVGLYDRMRGIGAHEVVVEAREHRLHLAEMEEAHIARVLGLCQDRLRDLQRDPRFKYVLLFKNHGAAAGATIPHPHLQLIATPVTPRAVAIELESAKAHFHVKERCLFCDILDFELDARERVVTLDENFAVVAPYASRFPFEMMIVPRKHSHSFADEPKPKIAALARSLRDLMARLRDALRDPPFNLVLHTAPNTDTLIRRRNYWDTLALDWHWHIEVLPRLTRVAGFESGTGFYINPTSPEEAAAFLRNLAV